MIRNSDLHSPLLGVLADDLADVVGDELREAVWAPRGQHDVNRVIHGVELDGVGVVEGETLFESSGKEPVDIGDDNLFELIGLNLCSHVGVECKGDANDETAGLASRIRVVANLCVRTGMFVGPEAGMVLNMAYFLLVVLMRHHG